MAMAKVAVNPKHINKLIKADQLMTKGGKWRNDAALAAVGVANDVLDELMAENMDNPNFIQQLKDYKVID